MSEEACQTTTAPEVDEAEKARLVKLQEVHDLITKSREATDKLYAIYQEIVHLRLYYAETCDFKTEKKLEWLGKRILAIYRANVGIEISLPDAKTIAIDLSKTPKKSGKPKIKGREKK